MTEFRMPSLGADMVAGRLVEWYKHPGDVVTRGDIIAEVDTDKGAIEVEVWTSGVIDRLLVEPGTRVPVGTVLAIIREAGEQAGAGPAPAPAPTAGAPGAERARVRASPLARKRAEELGLDLSALSGTGPGGSITVQDVETAARSGARPGAAGPPEEDARALRLRRAIAAAMTRSKREIPHYYLATTIDLGTAMEWLSAANRDLDPKHRLLPNALFLKAVALAAREYPSLNAWWEGERAVSRPGIHVGVAVSVRGGGLVTPALHDADTLSLEAVMQQMLDLVARARHGRLRSSELTDATITVTSLGERGVDTVTPIIYPPQVAIVGFGRIVERPWVVEGSLVARPVVSATLAADHRASDGHLGSLFLARIEQLLQTPEQL